MSSDSASLKVFSIDGQLEKTIALTEIIPAWNPEFYYPDAIFQTVVCAAQSNRLAHPHTKTKGEVSGGGKKPYRQKHTGRARQGSRRNPQFVGGGTAFGPRNIINHKRKVNKRVRALAMRSCWTDALERGKICVLSNKEVEGLKAEKTKNMNVFFNSVQGTAKRRALIVKDREEKVVLGSRNLEKLEVLRVEAIPINSLMKAECIVLSFEGFEWLKSNYFSQWK
ncbi:50S ribosomal protein L4 [Candidatus Mycoplasma haematolamae str. Purdue]|uniref:Large ribosomal subunit protein uL4 n=1 Tax=Mycoplasma haematolamae (strain Purdue) TaxID=1212765 RepID=I7B9G2_MYCHA|nr:50S ribosomal protein L4 [Candidatus Mycoplasma haematolamae]AFO51915.1 50S ribosomal protein L4 [Candidatus Mycoplasma haematolamae str. Purdue]